VTPGLALEIRFTVSLPLKTFIDRGPYESGLFYPDMLFFDISSARINGGLGEHAAYLYDGDVLLRTVTNTVVGNSYVEMGTFMSPDSLFFAGPDRQTVVGMGSILTRNIDGRLLVTISRGSLIIDSSDIRGTLGLGYYGTFAAGDDVNIVSIRTVHPQH
jgi:hypothetical protein